jgi:hypothetical protein
MWFKSQTSHPVVCKCRNISKLESDKTGSAGVHQYSCGFTLNLDNPIISQASPIYVQL